MTVSYLDTLANELLDAAVDALVATTTGHPAPGYSWVSHGPPAFDHVCDGGQVTVHVARVFHDPPFGLYGQVNTPPQTCAITPQVEMVITLVRCVPGLSGTGSAPSTSDMDDSAADLLVDLWALLTEVYDRFFADTLFSGPTQCADVTIGAAEVVEIEGQSAGWTLPVTVVANDSGPTGS